MADSAGLARRHPEGDRCLENGLGQELLRREETVGGRRLGVGGVIQVEGSRRQSGKDKVSFVLLDDNQIPRSSAPKIPIVVSFIANSCRGVKRKLLTSSLPSQLVLGLCGVVYTVVSALARRLWSSGSKPAMVRVVIRELAKIASLFLYN